MNLFVVIILLTGWIKASTIAPAHVTDNIYSRRGEFTPPPSLFDFEELNQALINQTHKDHKDLKKVKYYLINGDIKLARLHLSKMANTKTKLLPIVLRYLAITYFVEADFIRSLSYLTRPEVNGIPHFAKICSLKILNEIILNLTENLEENWKRCQIENPGKFNENLVWMETLIQLKLNPKRGTTSIPFKGLKLAALTNSDLKIFLKLAIYLNQEKLINEEIPNLTVEQLADPEIRELVGLAHFRQGSLARSYRFVEDLKSPNAENIKGSLYILRTKYELAYAQFKLALEQKQNSQNAMERLLPLAWLLGDWSNGSIYAERIVASPQNQVNKLTMAAAFHMQKGDFNKSERLLDTISETSRRGTHLDVTQLYSFVSLMQNKSGTMAKFADLSCAQYDLVNCWQLFQIDQWGTYPLIIKREDTIAHRQEWPNLTKEFINKPLKETVFVNQLDIEEMDDKLIQLIPKTTP